jgi:glucuronoxylan 4-O-methyltransferase
MIPTHEELKKLVESNPGQGVFEEYARLLDTIRAKAPAKLLIFGVGKDSHIWVRANEGGKTVFIEHEPEWIAKTREQIPGVEIIQVRYWTSRWQWRLLLHQPWLLRMTDLPDSVMKEKWDIIFVDSPQGGHWRRPGRMKSLYTASLLAKQSKGADVLVHDCDRHVEQVYSDQYLGQFPLVFSVATLRHYRV